jgi:hypothetical protein
MRADTKSRSPLALQFGLDQEVAQHLSENYGDRAWSICSMAKPTGLSWPLHGIRLAPGYPVIEAEVRYACRFEFAVHATDFIGRRSRLSFLNTDATIHALPRVLEIMAEEHKWDAAQVDREYARAIDYLRSMGISECVPCEDWPPPHGAHADASLDHQVSRSDQARRHPPGANDHLACAQAGARGGCPLLARPLHPARDRGPQEALHAPRLCASVAKGSTDFHSC